MIQRYPEELTSLIAHLKKLPGVGARTAERFAFELIGWEQASLSALSKILNEIRDKIPPCSVCGCLTDASLCRFCDLDSRDTSQLCILASPRDVFAVEGTKTFQGLYHVIEHLLSPLDGKYAHQLKIDRIEERIEKNKIREVILAFDSTLEGDTTSLYLKSHLSKLQVSVTRLAFGLPVGTNLESIDGGTLTRALKGRQTF